MEEIFNFEIGDIVVLNYKYMCVFKGSDSMVAHKNLNDKIRMRLEIEHPNTRCKIEYASSGILLKIVNKE